jgi:adenine-specific DNA methylase
MTQRLIEKWLPIAELGIESLRERTPMTPFPAPNRLHVWWARRPLVAARAAVLASLLPADADREKFMHVLGIHGDALAARVRIDKATREGVRLGADAYGYPRAFGYTPSVEERSWIRQELGRAGISNPAVLDPTAGGGSIPFEATRLRFNTFANDLNPVAALLLRATAEWPAAMGLELLDRFNALGAEFVRRVRAELGGVFPEEPEPDCRPDGYLWARTIACPYCDGLIPLSPNWRLAPDGTGVRLHPKTAPRTCEFEIVGSAREQSEGTVTGGDAKCPWPACGRVVDGGEVKRQAQAGAMGEQLYTVVFKRRVQVLTKTGRQREKWERSYRSPRPEDDNSSFIAARLAEKLPEWEALDVVPTEAIADPTNYERGHRMYGMTRWRDLFSARQLLCHGFASEVFRELAERELGAVASGGDPVGAATLGYLSLALDTMTNYGTRACRWDIVTERVRSLFDKHGFTLVWSYAEMASLVAGLGYDWCIDKTAKCIEELVELNHGAGRATSASGRGLLDHLDDHPTAGPASELRTICVTCQSADTLSHLVDGSIDCVVIDPPYYDNVMYAELSDFFYVWLKRTAGRVFPELFRRQLTDKDNEAVANGAKFEGQKHPKALASRDYQQRMAAIFAECHRVLKADGIMTLMFTHKATGAWDALASGLMEAGFTITASWPINTEAQGGLNIRDKSAANSTIFLVCRPRSARSAEDAGVYWEDVEPMVAAAVRERVGRHQAAGIGGVDLYLSCFGPALEEFAKHWPLRRGQPRPEALKKKKGQDILFPEALDPYAVTPEDALDAARREVKRWRLEQLLRTTRQPDLDPLTEWFVLAWDAFKAPEFPYDEGLRLARVVGLDLDGHVVGHLAEKKGSDLVLWDSAKRAAKGATGPADGSRAAIDALHHVAYRIRKQGLQAGRDFVERNGFDKEQPFVTALTAVLEVLPVSKTFTKVADEAGLVAEAASDFDALEHLRRLLFTDRIPEPQQLSIWTEGKA